VTTKITINPITRLEGHAKIEIFLNDKGDVEDTYWQVIELRGFERFCIGRPVEELPRITANICGVCPTPHNMASTKALDDLYSVEPTPTAKLIRQLHYNAFYVEDHFIHFFFLAAPDFILGPDADPAERNILGVVKSGSDAVKLSVLSPVSQPIQKAVCQAEYQRASTMQKDDRYRRLPTMLLISPSWL
jgi:F420-non-reducing hydrogenase large subunit